MMSLIVTVLNNGRELSDYLAKYTVGSKVTSPDGKQSWTINKVIQDTTLPPSPTGAYVTKVTLEVEDNRPSPAPPDPIPLPPELQAANNLR
jgi:hypothetical protein